MGDSEDFFFGTDNDVNVYWNGTYFCLDGLNAELRISFATAGVTKIYGGATSGDDLLLHANTVDLSSYIQIYGLGPIISHYSPGNYFQMGDLNDWVFKFSKLVATVSLLEGGVTTGDDFVFKANITDAYPKIELIGDSDINLKTNNAAKYVSFGVHTGTGDVVCNGNIPVKDEAGNIRKLMTCA